MSEYTNNITGEMAEDELKWLYSTAKNMNSIVEVGSWKGKSTHALLTGCKGIVWAVDHFKGSINEEKNIKEAIDNDIYQNFLNNVGHFKNLKVLKMESIEAAKKFKDRSIDMVFIDANHSYEAVREDIKAWLPKTRKLICGHDYEPNEWPGVVKAVNEKFKKTERTTNIWIYKLTKNHD